MDKGALLKLKRADIQQLAKRDGVKANGKTADIVEELVKKHHPLLVPAMGAKPDTPVISNKTKAKASDKKPKVMVEISTKPPPKQASAKRAPPAARSPAKSPTAVRASPKCADANASACPRISPKEASARAMPPPPPRIVLPKPAKDAGSRSPAQVSETGTEPAYEAPQPAPSVEVLCPTITELRTALRNVKPLTEQNGDVRNQLRELGILVDVVEKREARVREKVQRVQKMRLALGKHFFAMMKEDPRLTNGTWERPESKESEVAGQQEGDEKPSGEGPGGMEQSGDARPEAHLKNARSRPEDVSDEPPTKRVRRWRA
ncbi:uncharacterized protein TRAVEDRAFT_52189 [Trametes versicolor FP-101664 SS1]|uniref:uncharacterized protein n=1 Tax=Trametes versicolor (strain FP-101664) TaxID=717944 RepID=UPI0004622F53|nr:uncharacterized protein TRAVEDRAFT_52189 [Trametes versicolor FP-101664 SS1]EIW54484.1 hypothetical protein TRAVEDRAFT_52189 [Trametes versicolor FP-101664 SS1]